MIPETEPIRPAAAEAAVHGEATRAEQEERVLFSSIPEQNPSPIVEMDVDGNIRYMNPAAATLFPDMREQGLAHPWLAPCVTIIKQATSKESFTTVLEVEFKGRIYQQTICYAVAKGILRIFSLDITERKRMEEVLRQTRDEVLAIYDAMVDGLLIADTETKRFLRANSAICAMLGYSEEELLKLSVVDIHPAEKRQEALAAFEDQVHGRARVACDMPVLRRDGTIFDADISCSVLTYRGRLALLGIFRDITQRKRTEAALRQSRDELQAIYDHIVDGIIIVDGGSRRPLRVNSAFCRMVGYSEKEAFDLTPERVHPPDVLPKIREQVRKLQSGQVARLADLPFIRKDGKTIYADVIVRPIWYNDRSCYICLFHDVTERKQAHEALAREHRTLKLLLQSSDHERQLIAYEIHDGLAQQLAAALMHFETYLYQKDRLPELATKAFQAGVAMLRQGHFEARRLISGVRPPILDEAGIVAAIAHLVNEECRKGGPEIAFHHRVAFERLSTILENAIYRIVQEALNNACRHSKSDLVRVEMVQEDEMIRIEVRDQGVGFQPETIGESHFGLAGIRERARLLGGTASIESSPGQGTRVRIALPLILPTQDIPETPNEGT